MTKPKLYYFDAPVSRGEECRLALCLANVDFEDVRISREDWPTQKPRMPYGALPVIELPGKPMVAHSNAILALIGRMHGLHPSDPFEAACHEAMMAHVEDLRSTVGPTLRMAADDKKAARQAMVANYLPRWGQYAEANITGEPFFGGANPNVVDVKLYMAVRWFNGGKVDHIPATIFAAYPKLNRVHDAIADHASVKAWYARG